MPEGLSTQTDVWVLEDIEKPAQFPNGCFKLTYTAPLDAPEDEARRFKKLASKINMMAQSLGTGANTSLPNYERTNQIRANRLTDLRSLANKLRDGKLDDQQGRQELGHIQGVYTALSNMVQHAEAATMNSNEEEESTAAKTWVLKLNQLPEDATPEQVALSIDIQKAYDVVDIVMDRRHTRLDKAGAKLSGLATPASKQSLTVRKNYVRQLKEIADEGLLSRDLTVYAERKLELFKNAFVQREADRVKNHHVKALGFWAALFAGLFMILAAFMQLLVKSEIAGNLVGADLLTDAQNFLFLAVGACVGTWLSFTLRKVELGFDDLILLEPDRLNPTARIIFVVLLTCVIGGILQLQWVTVSFTQNPLTPADGFGPALLLGILCGIAERSLSGAVVSRADSMSEMVAPAKSTKGDA